MKTHRVKEKDGERIKCESDNCNNKADICEHGTSGIGYYYFCDKCHNERMTKKWNVK